MHRRVVLLIPRKWGASVVFSCRVYKSEAGMGGGDGLAEGEWVYRSPSAPPDACVCGMCVLYSGVVGCVVVSGRVHLWEIKMVTRVSCVS